MSALLLPYRHGAVRLLLLVLALGLSLGWLPVHVGAIQRVEAMLVDAMSRLLASEEPAAGVALIDIDDDSIAALGPWPWPRRRLAELAESALRQGAKAVVLDLVFPEPADAAGDRRLAELAQGGHVVLAQAMDFARREAPLRLGELGGAWPQGAPPGLSRPATGFAANHPALVARAPCVGHIGFEPDFDGQLRHLPLYAEFGGRAYPTLSLATLACLRGYGEAARLAAGQAVSGQSRWRIPYARASHNFLAYPARSLLEGDVGMDLEGRVLFVGSSSLSLSDRVATPLANSLSGVIVHAQSYSILADPPASGWQKPAAWLAAAVGMLAICLLWYAVSVAWPFLAVGALAALSLALWLASVAAALLAGGTESLSGPLWGMAVVLLVHLPVEWAWSRRQARAATRLLGRYVARTVLADVLRLGPERVLEPARREITVLIADMQDYTRLTHVSSLEDAATLTREFLDCLTQPVLAHGGTLDKYTGDGLVAFWGAPVPCEDHASRALAAALDIVAAVERYNARRSREDRPPVRVRVGLDTGIALVGDLGTSFRSTYTAVGDCINIASRLEAAARHFASPIVVSAATRGRIRDTPLHFLGRIALRGLGTEEEVFAPATGHRAGAA